jgi:hypothetical protein
MAESREEGRCPHGEETGCGYLITILLGRHLFNLDQTVRKGSPRGTLGEKEPETNHSEVASMRGVGECTMRN